MFYVLQWHKFWGCSINVNSANKHKSEIWEICFTRNKIFIQQKKLIQHLPMLNGGAKWSTLAYLIGHSKNKLNWTKSDWAQNKFSNQMKSNTELCVSSISEPTELNQRNQAQRQSTGMQQSYFTAIWQGLMPDIVWLCSVNKFGRTKSMLCGLTSCSVTVGKLW